MFYGLYWFESDIEDAGDDFSSHLADDLETGWRKRKDRSNGKIILTN